MLKKTITNLYSVNVHVFSEVSWMLYIVYVWYSDICTTRAIVFHLDRVRLV